MARRILALLLAGFFIWLAGWYGFGLWFRWPMGEGPAGPSVPRILAAYNRIILKCAQERPNVHQVNLHDPFLGHGIYARHFWRKHYCQSDPYCWYSLNIEDPNDRGYDAIRRLFLVEMAQVFSPVDKQYQNH